MKKLDTFLTYLAGGVIISALVWAIMPILGMLMIDLLWYATALVISYYLLRASQAMIKQFAKFLKLISMKRI